MSEFAPALFSTKVSLGRRTFFFDVKPTKDDRPYLKITESSIRGDEKKRVNLAVFQSEIPDFVNGLTQAVEYINQNGK